MAGNDPWLFLRRQNPISDYLRHNGVKMAHGKFACVAPHHDDKNPSASIFDDDEKWRCHACNLGGDIVDLVMLHRGIERDEAVKLLGGIERGGMPPPPPKKGSKPKLVREFGPVPDGVPPLQPPHIDLMRKDGANGYRKRVDHLYPYRDKDGVLQAYVGRLDATVEEGKQIFPIRWHLQLKAFVQGGFTKGERRPLFNEHKLKLQPEAEVLLVEGEKCAVTAQALLPEMVVCCWIGGKGQVQDADWSALTGRHLTLWRDNDKEGIKCMEIAASAANAACLLNVPMDESWEEGFDVADLADKPGAVVSQLALRRTYRFDISPGGFSGKWAYVSDGGWVPEGMKLFKTGQGIVKTSAPGNAFFALSCHPLFKSLKWDITAKRPIWNDKPVTSASIHFLHAALHDATGIDIAHGFEGIVESVAISRPFSSLADKIRSVKWDGISRISRLFTYFGATASEWHEIGLKRWFLGHTDRILNPGSKQDLVLILEGEQGIGKSTGLELLANAFGFDGYVRLGALGSARMNDSDMMMVAGKTLAELSELTALKRGDLDHFKDIVTRSSDIYRAPYTKEVVTVPRTASFVGTSNLTSDYLNDPTGARRFVPIACEHEIDLQGLQDDREMLYAEAVVLIEIRNELTYFTQAEEDLQMVAVAKRQTTGYIKARLMDFVESDAIASRDFIPEFMVWEHFSVGEAAIRERKTAFPEVKSAMLELGWTYQRIRTGEDMTKRQGGFTKAYRPRGRRWNKIKLTPPTV